MKCWRPEGVWAAVEPTAGTRLVREWEGAPHEVIVMSEGCFLCQGDRYRSLSEIARAIARVRWNGPRFFSLRPEVDAR